MKKDVKMNYVYNLLYQILVTLMPLITVPYLSRVLGADGIGIISFTESIVVYFVLIATLSVNTYGRREISYVQDDIVDRSKTFWEITIFKLCTTIISLFFYVLFVYHFVDTARIILYWILILEIITVAFDIVWFFQGLEEFKKVVIRNTAVKLIWVVIIFTFVHTKDDLPFYLLGQVLVNLAGAISLWFYLPKYIQWVPLKELRPFRNTKVALLLFIPAIAIQIYTVLDKTMIGLITQDAFQNGYYEQAMRISKMVLAIITAMGAVMASRVGNLYQKGDKAKIKKLIYRSYRLVWFLGVPMCLGLIGIANNFVPWFFGEGFEGVIPLLQVLSLLVLVIGLSNVTCVQYLLPTKQDKQYTISIVISACINFSLNIVLIRYYQAFGAAIASVIAESANAIMMFWIIRREFSISVILKSSVNYLFAGIVMLLLLLYEDTIFTPSIINTCIMICSGAGVYFAALALLKDEFFFDCCKSIFRMIFKK